jgi:hypothetical protein
MNPVGEPDAGNLHVRFDERGEETGRLAMPQATAPLLDSTDGEARLAIERVRAHTSKMDDVPSDEPLLTRLTFAATHVKGGKWRVELVWPNRDPEHVEDFNSQEAATTWIAIKSDAWLRKRLDVR